MVFDPPPVAFGDRTTGDTLINRRKDNLAASDDDDYFPGASTAGIFYDIATKFTTMQPQASRHEDDTRVAMQHFAGDREIKSFYCDNAPEFKKCAAKLGWPMPTSTPGRPETHGLVEVIVGKSKNGTRANLRQGGGTKDWWKFAGPHSVFSKNTQGGQDSPYYKKFGVESNHERFPWFSLVDYMPTPNPNTHPGPWEPRTKPGLFVGYHEQPGGRWSGITWSLILKYSRRIRMQLQLRPESIELRKLYDPGDWVRSHSLLLSTATSSTK